MKITLIVVSLSALLYGATVRDEYALKAYADYETCVAKRYHTTPAAWYTKHQEYPVCHGK